MNFRLFSAVAFLASFATFSVARANTYTCADYPIKPSGNYSRIELEGKEAYSVYLYSNTFFQTQNGQHSYQHAAIRTVIEEIVNLMPARLKKTSALTGLERAEQLQYVVFAANRLEILAGKEVKVGSVMMTVPKTTVTIFLPPCGYEITNASSYWDIDVHLDKYATSTTEAHVYKAYKPAFVLYRPYVTLRTAGDSKNQAMIFYDRNRREGVQEPCRKEPYVKTCSGTVALAATKKAKHVLFYNLEVRGDHETSKILDASYYAPRNTDELTLNQRVNWGTFMLSWPDSNPTVGNDIRFQYMNFTRINYRAVFYFGDLDIKDSSFTGIFQYPAITPTLNIVQNERYKIVCISGVNDSACLKTVNGQQVHKYQELYAESRTLKDILGIYPGASFHNGLLLSDTQGAKPSLTQISTTKFNNLVGGVVASEFAPGSYMNNNKFTMILGHALYAIPARMIQVSFKGNVFEKISSWVLKFASHKEDSGDPQSKEGTVGLYGSEISDNTFKHIGYHGGAILLSGVNNRIHRNTFDRSVDPSGWFKRGTGVYEMPDAHISTWAGNVNPQTCGNFNHAAGNHFWANKMSSMQPGSKIAVYLEQTSRDLFKDTITNQEWACTALGVSGDRSIEGNIVYHYKDTQGTYPVKLWLATRPGTKYPNNKPKVSSTNRQLLDLVSCEGVNYSAFPSCGN